MKELKKMLLIHWHYFSHTEIRFKALNFLTGSNAAGKSTLIDALQVVMLGETKSHIFNKAANNKSERTLLGYLKGEMGDDGETGFRYLRDGDFHAYILLEFYDREKKKPFIAGVVFDVFSDNTEKHNYFIADMEIPKHGFLKNQIPYTRDEFKAELKRVTNNRVQWFDTQNAYRRGLMAKCGQIKHKFFSLFKKAVPFTPITDIEQFITEYITDVKGRPDIESMQVNLRHYKRLEGDAKKIEERIQLLQAITEQHQGWKSKVHLQKKQEMMVAMGVIEKSAMRLGALNKQREKAMEAQQEIRKSLERLKENKALLEKQREEVIQERGSSDLQKKLNQMEQQEKLLKEEQAWKTEEWRKTLLHLKSISAKMESLKEENLPFSTEEGRYFADISMEEAGGESLEALSAFNEVLQKWNTHFQEAYFTEKATIERRKKSISNLKERLDKLKEGVKDYPQDVHRLVAALEEEELEEVRILSDLLELNEEGWRSAIEGYLHTQRFYVFVREEDYEKALKVYASLRKKSPVYQVGLVDVEKIRTKKPSRVPGSLAEKLSTEDERAQVFLDYVLGNVMACEKVEDLRRYGKAITKTGMLYQSFVARQFDPKRGEVHYIGRDAVRHQIQRVEEEIKQEDVLLKAGEKRFGELALCSEIKSFTKVEKDIHATNLSYWKRLMEIVQVLEELEKERSSLDLSYLDQLEEKLLRLKEDLAKTEVEAGALHREDGSLSGDLKRLAEMEIPGEERRLLEKQEVLQSKDFDVVREEAEKEYLKRRESLSVEDIVVNYERTAKGTETDKKRLWSELMQSRGEYNRIYLQSHDLQNESNQVFEKTWRELTDIKLPEYVDKIKEAGEKASQQFQEDFLSKLKENFDTVEQQIRELNRAIKNSPFGRDRYRFEVKPKPEMRHFYDMITDELLMGSGMSILKYAFENKHKDAIEELFRMITDVEEDAGGRRKSQLEQNISIYTNYQSYLQFDLIVTDEDGVVQRLSKTLLKKSGGETQTPFYLSVLASFAHMYRVNQKGSPSDTIRLIVFDEAFNKMDQQRIEESLKLLRGFELQAIISAPPDKMREIAPFADQNLLVLRQGNHSFVQEFTNKEARREIS